MINRSSLPTLVKREIIKGFTGTYDAYPTNFLKFFDNENSSGQSERYKEIVGFGRHKEKMESAQAELDNVTEGPATLIYNKSYALAYQISYEMISDNEYPQILRDVMDMGRSAAETRESVVIDRLNTAFSSATANLLADGKALCATDHPIYKPALDGSVSNSNRPVVASSLSEASLTIDLNNIAKFKSPAGLTINTKAEMLIVPVELDIRAQKLLFTDLSVGNANNDINPMARNRGRLPGGYLVSQFLTDTDAYFIRTNHRGLVYQEREGRRIMEDMLNRQVAQEFVSYMRFGVGAYDHRSIYGNPGF